ncbi:Arylsulfatase [Rosistilla ulvae]|uniref:Arylsulfatase n=1 Tax=Rosistilla ulvae TaxID=1930277 RepID=A0A517M0M0_9BACT|nr:sulfatase [Rosistilla ulvae]QDS88379.1 Arylsulfatase [Rosistilla ulvae]
MLRLLAVGLALMVVEVGAAERPNVLFIAVDDLRPELACYGKQHIHSPNIDRLAASGVLFERAYCMVPTCGASRASMMSGIRPSRNRFVNYLAWAEKDAPGIKTLNTHFRENGYHTVSLGKIFHHPQDNAVGWSEPAWRPTGIPWYRRPENHSLHEQRQRKGSRTRGPAWEAADVADDAYADGKLAERAIADLRRLKKQDSPFFLAVGFFKPHLPFIAPQKYWDLYDRDAIQLPPNYATPQDAPPQSLHSSGELRAYAGIPSKGPVSDATAKHLIHGYYACVSYVDALIGTVLDELDALGLADNTVVVLWGDHGWNLGEHTLWCKHSCYETSMQIPLIIRAPGVNGGERRSGLVESIDIYPTLCELTQLPLPTHLQGKSLVALMGDTNAPWKTAAVGRYQAGDTIRTDRFRFSEYRDKSGRTMASMLYDHSVDENETTNIAKNRGDLTSQLSEALHDQMGRNGVLGAAPGQPKASER